MGSMWKYILAFFLSLGWSALCDLSGIGLWGWAHWLGLVVISLIPPMILIHEP